MYPPRTNSNRYFCAWAVQFLRICILPFLLQSLMGLSEGLTFLLRLFSELSLVLLAVLEEPSLQAWNLWDHDGSFPGIFLLRRCGHALLELDTPSLDPIQLLDKSKNAISRWSMNWFKTQSAELAFEIKTVSTILCDQTYCQAKTVDSPDSWRVCGPKEHLSLV